MPYIEPKTAYQMAIDAAIHLMEEERKVTLKALKSGLMSNTPAFYASNGNALEVMVTEFFREIRRDAELEYAESYEQDQRNTALSLQQEK